ncbi:Chaperone protein dnaJ 16-like protein [Drosera capensis]
MKMKMPTRKSRSRKENRDEEEKPSTAAVEEKQVRRDPYEVLGVQRNCTDQELKYAYRKLALNGNFEVLELYQVGSECSHVCFHVEIWILELNSEDLAVKEARYHPDKNANDPKAADMFKEVTFSYNILSDPDKRCQYDTAGFQAVESESQELELDLSNLGAVNTMFAAIFSKLGVPIKTTVAATMLEEALSGAIITHPLRLGERLSKKVEKQCADFYSVIITEEEARGGLVCRVQSSDRSKFKLLYFDQEENGGLSLALQEDSTRTGKVTSAGMYFLGFPVYRLDHAANSLAASKDPDAAFFKKLDGFQSCEVTELKAGTHVFAVYGDNFFRSASYTIEALCAASFAKEKEDLRTVEAQILSKRVELSKFESEYREVLAQFTEMTARYTQEMQTIDVLLKQRNEIHASYSVAPPKKRSASKSKKSSSKEPKEEEQLREKKPARDRLKKRRWLVANVAKFLLLFQSNINAQSSHLGRLLYSACPDSFDSEGGDPSNHKMKIQTGLLLILDFGSVEKEDMFANRYGKNQEEVLFRDCLKVCKE